MSTVSSHCQIAFHPFRSLPSQHTSFTKEQIIALDQAIIAKDEKKALKVLDTITSLKEVDSRTISDLLIRAISSDLLSVLEKLVEKGADPTVTDATFSCLHFAAHQESPKFLKFLLGTSAKQHINLIFAGKQQDSNSISLASPLSIAVLFNYPQNVKLLVEAGADLLFVDHKGRTILEIAETNKYRCTQSKIAEKADAIWKYLMSKKKDYVQNTLALLEMDTTDKSKGATLLLQAVKENSLSLVQAIVQRGISPAAVVPSQDTCLHKAASLDNPKLLDYLLHNGGKKIVNLRTSSQLTALAIAVFENRLENVELLVEAGADLSLRYSGQEIIVDKAKQNQEKHSLFYSKKKERQKATSIYHFLLKKSEEPPKPLTSKPISVWDSCSRILCPEKPKDRAKPKDSDSINPGSSNNASYDYSNLPFTASELPEYQETPKAQTQNPYPRTQPPISDFWEWDRQQQERHIAGTATNASSTDLQQRQRPIAETPIKRSMSTETRTKGSTSMWDYSNYIA